MIKTPNDDNVRVPEVESHTKSEESVQKKYYFDNLRVEELLIEYVTGGCVSVHLRDAIMSHASELIKQVIRTHKLDRIYQGRDRTGFSDLFQIAWAQIESTLYKFDTKPGHKKVFNMWSQVARTVILAHIKKESRHRQRSYADSYKRHLVNRHTTPSPDFTRFIMEIRKICEDNDDYLRIIEAMERVYETDSKPSDGLIYKLAVLSELPKAIIQEFFEMVRANSVKLTDSPDNLAAQLIELPE